MVRIDSGVLPPGLAYLRTGTGPPLVVLPGLSAHHEVPTGRSRRFELAQFGALPRHREVWWVNRRRGLSPAVSMADLADDYADVLDSLFGRPVDVLGSSTGGSVALRLAADHPDVVRRLVLVGSAFRLGERGKAVQRQVGRLLRQRRYRAAGSTFFAMLGGTAWSRRLLAGAGWLLGNRFFGTQDTGDVVATIEAEDAFDLRSRLGGIRTPTLVVSGDRDAFYDEGRLCAQTAALMPDGRYVRYAGKGHAAAASDRRLARDVLAFLDA